MSQVTRREAVTAMGLAIAAAGAATGLGAGGLPPETNKIDVKITQFKYSYLIIGLFIYRGTLETGKPNIFICVDSFYSGKWYRMAPWTIDLATCRENYVLTDTQGFVNRLLAPETAK